MALQCCFHTLLLPGVFTTQLRFYSSSPRDVVSTSRRIAYLMRISTGMLPLVARE